jgi:hypothetical protein
MRLGNGAHVFCRPIAAPAHLQGPGQGIAGDLKLFCSAILLWHRFSRQRRSLAGQTIGLKRYMTRA